MDRPPEWDQERMCVGCKKPVEEARRCYATPICYSCLPPPRLKKLNDLRFEESRTQSEIDTRYRGGVAEWYAREMARAIGGKASDYTFFIAAATEFVDETTEWHEEHRHNFEPHASWKSGILSVILRRAAQRAWELGFGQATNPDGRRGIRVVHEQAAIDYAYGKEE